MPPLTLLNPLHQLKLKLFQRVIHQRSLKLVRTQRYLFIIPLICLIHALLPLVWIPVLCLNDEDAIQSALGYICTWASRRSFGTVDGYRCHRRLGGSILLPSGIRLCHIAACLIGISLCKCCRLRIWRLMEICFMAWNSIGKILARLGASNSLGRMSSWDGLGRREVGLGSSGKVFTFT